MSTLRPRGAFTLVELMLATALTSLIVVFLAHSLGGLADIWRANEERTDTIREARAAFELLARDLAAVSPMSGTPVLFPDRHPDTAPEDRGNQEIYMLTHIANGGRSDLCAVGYYCRWEPELKAFVLMRHLKDSDKTSTAIRRAVSAGSNPLTFLDLFSRDAGVDDQLAAFIWDVEFARPYPQPAVSDQMPEMVEVRFKAMSPIAGRKLRDLPITRETWTGGVLGPDAELYRRVILPHQQQLIARVKLAS